MSTNGNGGVLYLPLKTEYFWAIAHGNKLVEYRRDTPYWRKRLAKDYDSIELMLGYPKRDDNSRRIRRSWRGWWMETITHKHFGPKPVRVFAIPVNP